MNAPPEYFKAGEKFRTAKTNEERIVALEEMIRVLPKHKGCENQLAQLKAKLAKIRKESAKQKKGARKIGVGKEGEAQVCLIGFTNSGKSSLLTKLTNAKPEISWHPYTTTKPEIGMLDYKGIKIQLVEIPSTFDPEYMSTARSSDAIVLVVRGKKEESRLKSLLDNSYVRVKSISVNPFAEPSEEIKEKIWKMLDFVIVYTKRNKSVSPMALKTGSTVKSFAERIHKDFVKNFLFARLWRKGIVKQVGQGYVLQNGDILELHMK